MAYLLHSGKLQPADIDFYFAYSTQIYAYASTYDREAVLDFDYQYRVRRAEHSFQLGIRTANMELQLLIPRIRAK